MEEDNNMAYTTYMIIHTKCNEIYKKIKDQQFDIIVPIVRGGMIPATILSHLLKIKNMKCIYASSYDNYSQNDLNIDFSELEKLSDRLNILVVDDLCDTGNTIHAIREWNLTKNHNLTIVTLDKKDKQQDYSHSPDIYVSLYNKDLWIVYPWE